VAGRNGSEVSDTPQRLVFTKYHIITIQDVKGTHHTVTLLSPLHMACPWGKNSWQCAWGWLGCSYNAL